MNEKVPDATSDDVIRPIGIGRRIGAVLYDSLLLLGIQFLASLIIVALPQINYGQRWYPAYVIYVCAIGYLFFGWFWTHGGQTLGMKTWGMRIERIDGQPITWGKAFIRFLAALLTWAAYFGGLKLIELLHPPMVTLCWIVYSVIFWWLLFDRRSLGLHDRLSGTVLNRVTRQSKKEGE